jgi:hypothetical protein
LRIGGRFLRLGAGLERNGRPKVADGWRDVGDGRRLDRRALHARNLRLLTRVAGPLGRKLRVSGGRGCADENGTEDSSRDLHHRPPRFFPDLPTAPG